jgi:hypothetical protein
MYEIIIGIKDMQWFKGEKETASHFGKLVAITLSYLISMWSEQDLVSA